MTTKALNFSSHITEESALRRPSPLKCAYSYTLREGMITMGGGLPEPCYFPFVTLEAVVPRLGFFSEKDTHATGDKLVIDKYRSKENNVLSLAEALQYAQGYGVPDFLKFVTEFTNITHQPPYEDWQCSITAGNTQGLALCLRMLCSRGDVLLLEEFAYPAAVETAEPMGLKLCGIPMDSEGIRDDLLEEKLRNWDERVEHAKRPSVLYLVPCGQNPSGATLGINRRKHIYEICQKYDIIIIEDDPYYFLQMQPYVQDLNHDMPLPTADELVQSLLPSFLKLDKDGRVLRLDSFSKVVAPNSRCGWITGCAQLIERVIRHNEVSIQTASGFSQALLYHLLAQRWGHLGFLDWLVYIRSEYTHRRNKCLVNMEKYLSKDVFTWTPPAAGMFIWIKVDHTQHPDFHTLGVQGVEDRIFNRALEEKVLVIPGSWFSIGIVRDVFLRANFASIDFDKGEEAIQRLSRAVEKEFGLH